LAAVAPAPKSGVRLAEHRPGIHGQEPSAEALYLDAMDKLKAGDRATARAAFESILARFPDSAAADLARRELGHLAHDYAASAGLEISVQATPAGAALPRATPVLGRPGAWDQELRRNAAIQARLRNEAGDRIFFSAGSSELGSRARTALAAQAQWLNRWSEFEAAITGHADEPGSEEQNELLARERAEAVRVRLIEEGVEGARLAVVAFGRSEPIAPCSEPLCAAQNRRVVTLVFASGTRARLGLVSLESAAAPPPGPTSAAPARPALFGTMPAASERVGITR